MIRVSIALLAALVVVTALPAKAEPLVEPSSKTTFEKSPSIDDTRYTCLGTGIRKKAIFRVYAMVFCIEEASAKAQVAKYFEGPGSAHAALKGRALAEALRDDPGFFRYLMAMPVGKSAQMVFLRKVEAASLKQTFSESLNRALGSGETERIGSFVNLMTDDVKDGERLSLRTSATGRIDIGVGTQLKQLKDEKIAGAVWESYFGPAGVSSSLKASVAAGFAALR